MVVFDATTLTLLLKPDASAPADPRTGKPVENAGGRIDAYVGRLAKDRQRILIPTPVLSEVLVQSGSAAPAYVQRLQKLSVFEIADFDVLAAIELALMQDASLATGDKKLGETDVPWQKIKVDRQIVAIAKVKNAKIIFTDDGPLSRFAVRMGLLVVRLHTLPLPSVEGSIPPPDMFITDVEDAVVGDGSNDGFEVGPPEEEFPAMQGDRDEFLVDYGADAIKPVFEGVPVRSGKPETIRGSTIVGDTLAEVMRGLVGDRGGLRLPSDSGMQETNKFALPAPEAKKPDAD